MRYASTLLVLVLSGMLGACSMKPVTTPADAQKSTETGKAEVKPALPAIPEEANRLFQEALAQIRNGQADEAIGKLDLLKEKYPQFSGSHVNLGLIYLGKNDLKKAELAFQNAIQVSRQNPVAYTHLGILYRRQGKFNEAEQAYLEAIKINPGYTLAQLNIGILYDIYLHNAEKALHHYNTYQGLLTDKDKQVSKWIIDLERRLKTARKGKGGNS